MLEDSPGGTKDDSAEGYEGRGSSLGGFSSGGGTEEEEGRDEALCKSLKNFSSASNFAFWCLSNSSKLILEKGKSGMSESSSSLG